MIARVHPRPANLPIGLAWCGWCGTAFHKALSHGCSEMYVPAPPAPARAAVRRPKAGSDAEAMLAAQLAAAGYFDATFTERPASIGRDLCYRREVPWGLALSPERGFRFDIAFVFQRVAVECVGGAHAAGRKKVRADTERAGMAAGLGWRTIPVTPEQVREGSAVALVAKALEVSK